VSFSRFPRKLKYKQKEAELREQYDEEMKSYKEGETWKAGRVTHSHTKSIKILYIISYSPINPIIPILSIPLNISSQVYLCLPGQPPVVAS